MKRARLSSISRIHSHPQLTLFLERPLFYNAKMCAELRLVRRSAGESASLDVSSTLNPWLENKEPDAVPSLTRPAQCSYCEMASGEKTVSKKLSSQLRVGSNKRDVASGAMWKGRTDS